MRVGQVAFTADHVRDFHGDVIDNAGKIVRGTTITAQNHGIADLCRVDVDAAVDKVGESNLSGPHA